MLNQIYRETKLGKAFSLRAVFKHLNYSKDYRFTIFASGFLKRNKLVENEHYLAVSISKYIDYVVIVDIVQYLNHAKDLEIVKFLNDFDNKKSQENRDVYNALVKSLYDCCFVDNKELRESLAKSLMKMHENNVGGAND